ncbi:hypothetical protein AGRA3207_003959 [Actinomadura graeca]|uniref:Uncharacterized protein n=1 Tax=Actinomadura graeca TaxID=2750812 RepID=A0ABX8QY25_9ACTN|nr:hypothetical protein [Actinomadura graeca]QXJ22884.1 hypothetical protein AGRA3207_003959 [Actinomadura graeca]
MTITDQWFYPRELEGDLAESGLSPGRIAETLAQTWEYNRSVVPHFTNWDRYLALARLCAVGIVGEVFGDMVDVLSPAPILGYDIDELLDELFGNGAVRDEMAREYRASLLFMTEKSSGRRNSRLMRCYADALAHSPIDWFRLRDCDAMLRFFIAAAIACNDDVAWLGERDYRLVTEMGVGLYDAVAFYKHRAEGEIHNTYAYVGPEVRQAAFRSYREALWALDTQWARTTAGRSAVNFTRLLGGPIHVMMRRYRFVEDGLKLGEPETTQVVALTRKNTKLWYRNDVTSAADERYEAVLAQKDRVLFAGLANMLTRPDTDKCPRCRRRPVYGAEEIGEFGGIEPCPPCRATWQDHLRTFPERARDLLSRASG